MQVKLKGTMKIKTITQTLSDGTKVNSLKVKEDGICVVNDDREMPMKQFHSLGGIVALHHPAASFGRGAFRFFENPGGSSYKIDNEFQPFEEYNEKQKVTFNRSRGQYGNF